MIHDPNHRDYGDFSSGPRVGAARQNVGIFLESDVMGYHDRHPAASVETPPSDHYRLCRSWRSGDRRAVLSWLASRAPRSKPRLVGPYFSTRAVALATQGT